MSEGVLDNQDFVEWAPYITEVKNDQRTLTPLGFHRCNEHDYDNFYPVAKSDVETLKEYKKKGLLCLDKTDKFGDPLDFRLFKSGDWGSTYRDLTLLYRPCIPRVIT
jgi:hypothetical protein